MSPFWILLPLMMMEAVVTTGAIRRAKLQSNLHRQQTNTQVFYRPDALPVTQPTVSEHWMKVYDCVYRRMQFMRRSVQQRRAPRTSRCGSALLRQWLQLNSGLCTARRRPTSACGKAWPACWKAWRTAMPTSQNTSTTTVLWNRSEIIRCEVKVKEGTLDI